MAIEKG